MFIKTKLLQKYHYDENLSITSDWKFCIQTLIFGNSSYKGVDVIVSAYDTSGLSYSSRDRLLAERSEVLESLFPKRVLDDMRSLVFGDTFEDKLYIRIKSSKYNKFFYSLNVIIIKLGSLLSKNSIHEFPNRL